MERSIDEQCVMLGGLQGASDLLPTGVKRQPMTCSVSLSAQSRLPLFPMRNRATTQAVADLVGRVSEGIRGPNRPLNPDSLCSLSDVGAMDPDYLRRLRFNSDEVLTRML
jgi:hypothetical protein